MVKKKLNIDIIMTQLVLIDYLIGLDKFKMTRYPRILGIIFQFGLI